MAMTSMRPQDHEGFSSLVNVDYLPLYRAALNGDWERATSFMRNCPNAVTARITTQSMTALHVAARAGRSDFVEKLVAHELMSQTVLAIQDCWGCTAVHYAAMSATKNAVKAMVNKYPDLTQVMDNNQRTPLFFAASWGNKEVVHYLCSTTTDHPPAFPSSGSSAGSAFPFSGPLTAPLICAITRAGFHDVAMDLVLRYPHLATARDGKYSVLRVLAEMPSAFRSGSRLGFLGSLAHKCGDVIVRDEVEDPGENSRDLVKRISTAFRRILFRTMKILVPACHWEKKSRLEKAKELVKLVCEEVSRMNKSQIEEFFKESSILTTAASNGIEEIVRLCCLQYFPYLIYLTIDQKTILYVAVEHRRKRIFNLLKEIATNSGIVHLGPNNILHAVAKLPPSSRLNSIDGTVSQMVSEVRWFKDVKKFFHREQIENETAWEVFMDEHKQLAEDGAKWVKETSNYCMVVAALVTTVTFAAAFTVPGGINSDNGTPNFLEHTSFRLFVVSDSMALFFSSYSIIVNLHIMASISKAKFIKMSLLPTLANALAALSFAIIAMLFAFGLALWIIVDAGLRLWTTILFSACLLLPFGVAPQRQI